MPDKLGHDIGYTLWLKCNSCGREIMWFGEEIARNPEHEAEQRLRLERKAETESYWRHLSGDNWLCNNCDSKTATQS